MTPIGRRILVAGVGLTWVAGAFGDMPTVPPGYTIEPYVTGLRCPSGLAFSPGGQFGNKGELFVADPTGPAQWTVYRAPAKDSKVVFASGSDGVPMDIAFAPPASEFGQYLYVLLYMNNKIKRVDPKGAAQDFAGVGHDSLDLEFGPGGKWGTNLFHLNSMRLQGGEGIYKWTPDGTVKPVVIQMRENLLGMAFGPGGKFGEDLYLAFGGWKAGYGWNHDEETAILRLAHDGSTKEFLRSPEFGALNQLAFDTTGNFGGNLFATDYGQGKVFQITPEGKFTTFLTGLKTSIGWGTGDIAFGPDGAMYVAGGTDGTVWRIAGSAIGLTRSQSADTVVCADGNTLTGTVTNESFTVRTFLGAMKLPSEQVVGMAAGKKGTGRFLLTDGQVVCGELPEARLGVKLAAGGNRELPFEHVKQWSYRVSVHRPGQCTPTAPIAVLATGDRLALDANQVKLPFRTACGTVWLEPNGLLEVMSDSSAEAPYRARFVNGSTLSGCIEPNRVPLPFRLVGRLEVPRDMIVSLRFAEHEQGAPWLTRLALGGGDELRGRIAQRTLKMTIDAGTVEFNAANIKELRFDTAGVGRAAAKLWSGSSLQGQVEDRRIAFQIYPGPELAVPVEKIVAIVGPTSLPPDQVVPRVRELVARLGAGKYKEREQATEELYGIGPAIIPLLEGHLGAGDPEVRERIKDILARLRGSKGE